MTIISKLISKLASKQIKEAKIQAKTEGYQEGINKYWNEKEQRLEHQYNTSAVGKKIIYCSNEWQDPHFGIIEGTEKVTAGHCLMVKSKDVLTGEIHFIHPESFFYTDEMFTLAILKLNPFERWNMSIGKLSHMSLMWNKSYRKESISDKQELTYELRKCGFLFKDSRTSLWLDSKVNGRNNQWTENFHKYEYSVTQESQDLFCIHVYFNDEQIFELNLSSHQEVQEFKNIVGRSRFK